MTIKNSVLPAFLLVFLTLVILAFTVHNKPVGDFGNYYYGRKIFHDRGNAKFLYADIHGFNEQIRSYGETNYFENYTPVPPFSLVFYYPFIFLKSASAKLLFNILGSLVLCFSLYRFLRESKLQYKYVMLLFVLALPLYNNMVQGQSYTVIAALLIEVWLAHKHKNYFMAGFCIALLFHLKLFPALILVYFIIRKEYRLVLWSTAMTLVLFFISLLAAGKEVVINYYTEIVPRLLRNEVVDPYYYGHQSSSIFFRNLFSYDVLSNPSPLADLPFMAVICESIITGLVIYAAYMAVKKSDDFSIYALFAFFIVIINPYVPSYSLLLLLPFVLSLAGRQKGPVFLLLLFIACNLPSVLFATMPFLIKYTRLIILLIVCFLYVKELALKINYLAAGLVIGLLIFLKGKDSRDEPGYYFPGTVKTGIYYNMAITGNNIVLNRCLGSIDETDTLQFPEPVKSVMSIASHPALQDKRCRIRKILVINENILLYLSDLGQGIGMYKPRIQKLR